VSLMKTDRTNLVIVRTGSTSSHAQWHQKKTRNFDIINLTYSLKHQYQVHYQDRIAYEEGAKNGAIFSWLQKNISVFDDYEFIMLIDDDIDTCHDDLDRLFQYAKLADFEICQPALDQSSFFTLAITKRHPSFLHRWTNSVEIMCPIFKSSVLKKCMPTLEMNKEGGGNIENLWNHACQRRIGGIAIIDKISVHHNRETGSQGSGTKANSPVDPLSRQQMISLMTCSFPMWNNICALKLNGTFIHFGEHNFLQQLADNIVDMGLQHHGQPPEGMKLNEKLVAENYLTSHARTHHASQNCPMPAELEAGLTELKNCSKHLFTKLLNI